MHLSRIFVVLLVAFSAFADAAKRNYYDVLGVAPSAEQAEIRRAYRQLSLKYHPDKNKAPDAEKQFVEVAEAYTVLSNAEKRAQYDAMGGDSERFARSAFKDGQYNTEDAFDMFSKIFDNLEEFFQNDEAIDRMINEFGEPDPSRQSYTEMFIKSAVKKGIKWLGPQIMTGEWVNNVQVTWGDGSTENLGAIRDRYKQRQAKRKTPQKAGEEL